MQVVLIAELIKATLRRISSLGQHCRLDVGLRLQFRSFAGGRRRFVRFSCLVRAVEDVAWVADAKGQDGEVDEPGPQC